MPWTLIRRTELRSVFAPAGMIDERLIHRREDAEVERSPLLLELAERRARLEVGHAGKPGVGKERGRERQHAAHVAERQGAPPDVVARQPIPLDHRGRCADDGLVTEPAPLRVGARTGGVHQESVVADCNRSGRVVDRLLGHVGRASCEGVRVEEAGRPRRAEQDARAQRGGIGELQRGRILGVGEAG